MKNLNRIDLWSIITALLFAAVAGQRFTALQMEKRAAQALSVPVYRQKARLAFRSHVARTPAEKAETVSLWPGTQQITGKGSTIDEAVGKFENKVSDLRQTCVGHEVGQLVSIDRPQRRWDNTITVSAPEYVVSQTFDCKTVRL